VPDVLIYWRDYVVHRGTSPAMVSGLPDESSGNDDAGGVHLWHSSAKCIAELQPDDHVHMTGPAVEVFTGDWPD